MSVSSELKTFEGSVEEKVFRTALKEPEFYDFANLVIETCNVLKAISFENADIVLQSMYLELSKEKAFSAEDIEDLDKVSTNVEYTIVAYDQLVNTEVAKKLIDCGISEVREDYKAAVLAMLKFLRDRKHHQEALSGMRGVGDKATVAAVMAQHLFSPLTAGNDYVIDNRSESFSRYCPCEKENCKSLMKSGCTSLGSSQTWHGHVDIILKQNVAVSFLEIPSKKNKHTESDDDLSDWEEEDPSDPIQINRDDGYTVEVVGPTSKKRICKCDSDTEEDALMASQHKEDKARTDKKCSANVNAMDQLIALTITNAFSQVNETPALSGWLIPTIGCTLDHVTALFYDSQNDVLLQSVDQIPLWGLNGLYIPSIVQIWMFVNFTVFTFKDLANDLKLNRSDFHNLAKNRLKYFRKIKCGRALNPVYNCDFYSDVLTRMRKKGRKAPKKLKEH